MDWARRLKWLAIGAMLCSVAGAAHGQEDRSQARSLVISQAGIVAAEHPFAAQAGALVLAQGGNAVDAAVAANAVMGVVAPMMAGIGGDLFAMVYDPGSDRLYGLDASGWSPAALTLAKLNATRGTFTSGSIDAFTVPGAVDGWDKLLTRFGRKTFPDVLAPAIGIADRGFPVSEVFAQAWAASINLRPGTNGARTFLIDGKAPAVGQVFRNPDLAASLRLIAAGGRDAFYKGEIARRILDTSTRLGGVLQASDLDEYSAEWVEPISTSYRGWTVSEMPPATIGFAALAMLNVMERFPLAAFGPGSTRALHVMIEAKKLAYADLQAFDGDPRFAPVPVGDLLAKAYAARRAALIDPHRATCGTEPGRTDGRSGDTTTLSVVDRDGLMVTLVQSNFSYFGTGIVPEGSGFALQDRGSLFSLDPASPNVLAGRKRPLHTLLPAFLSKGPIRIAFGIMGGYNQAQAHAQFVSDVVDFGMNVQAALEAPRFTKTSFGGCDVMLEDRIAPAVRTELAALGHRIELRGAYAPDPMGSGQAVSRDFTSGVNFGASDPRKDGQAAPEPDWAGNSRK